MPSELRANLGSSASKMFLASVFLATCMANGHAQVTISSAMTQNVTCSNGICAPTASDAVLNVTDLENLLATANVEITTTGSGVQANDIYINAPFGWSSSSARALDAYVGIAVNKPVADNGQGSLSVTTNDGGSGGTFSFGKNGRITIATISNVIAINGVAFTLENSIDGLASAIAANPSGDYALINGFTHQSVI